MTNKIKTVELFAGVGGFRLGLEAASKNFDVIWANQWEPYRAEQFAYDCYVSHFGHSTSHVCADISIVKNDIPYHDLLVGGFPCQDYSILNKNAKGLDGKKGKLWWHIDDILRSKSPKYVILENVDRIIRSPEKQVGRDLSMILRCFYDNSYIVEWRVINAADHGQAQRRRRAFIVAYHKDTEIYKKIALDVCKKWLDAMERYVTHDGVMAKAFPVDFFRQEITDRWIDEMEFPSLKNIAEKQKVSLCNAGMMVNGRVFSIDVVPKRARAVPISDILERGPVDESYFLKKSDIAYWKYLKGAKKGSRYRADGTKYLFSEGAVPFPDRMDLPARTLVTSEGAIARTSHVVIDKMTGRLRTLTPIECERLNGFPDGWTDTGMPTAMRRFCMGNALVVPIVTMIGKSLLSAIYA